MTTRPPSDTLEAAIGRLLNVGTVASVLLLALGAVLALADGASPVSGAPPFAPGRILADIVALRPVGFIWLGLFGTLVTPAARVIAALVGYARLGERAMVGIAILILLVIAAGIVSGTVGA